MMIGINFDITEQKEAEVELHKLSLAIKQSPVSIIITDTRGVIEFVNPAFTRMTGYSGEEVIGMNPRFLKSGQTSPETYNKLWSMIVSGKSWEGNLLNKRKDGRLYWEHCSISAIHNEFGEITHYVASKEDITERKQLEGQLEDAHANLKLVANERKRELYRISKQKQELAESNRRLEDASRIKSDFLANMSHELRTPLNAVIGFSDVLQRQNFGVINQKQSEYLSHITSIGKHLLALINDVLDLSKVESGKMPFTISYFSLGKR